MLTKSLISRVPHPIGSVEIPELFIERLSAVGIRGQLVGLVGLVALEQLEECGGELAGLAAEEQAMEPEVRRRSYPGCH